MTEYQLWGALLRLAQSVSQASPFVLTGFIITAIFRRWIGPDNLRSLFAEGTWRALPQAWAIGMLLPVCSLGVIPIMREMRRAGLSGGTILAFGLTAPLFNPLSVLYGLTLSEPFTIFAFSLCSLVVVTCIGILFDCLFRKSAVQPEERNKVSYGLKRLLSVAISMGKEFWSWSTIYMLVGLSGIVLLNFVLPKGAFQASVNGGDAWAPILMTGVAVPVYATPMLAMSQLGMMFQHGNSVGAAFALLILGTGLNFGIIAWMYFAFGFRKATTWLVALIGVVLALGYALEKPLYPTGIEVADHSHAFDIYCCPFSASESGYPEIITRKLKQDVRPEEIFAMIGLGITALIGLLGFAVQRAFDLEAWLAKPSEDRQGIDFVLPNSVLAGAAICGLVALSIVMCFTYYPNPEECLDEIFVYKGEVLSAANSGDYGHAMHFLPIWEDWNRRLQVGVYLRYGSLSEYHRMKALVVRDTLELLEHAIEDEEQEEVRKYALELSRAHFRLNHAYRNEL